MSKIWLYVGIVFLFSMVACTETDNVLNLVPPVLISPEDGSTITENPPTFIWHAVEGDSCDIVCRIEIASDSTFNLSSIIISTMVLLPDTTFSPQDSIASGTYYWHMCTRQNA